MNIQAASDTCARALGPVKALPRNRRKTERGFTLLELMYSLGLFAVGLLGMVQFQVAALSAAKGASNLSIATNLTSSTMERLRVVPVGELAGTTQLRYDQFGFELSDGEGGTFFTVTWSAEDMAGYVDLTVETTWQSRFPRVTDHVHRVRMTSRVF